MAATTARAPQRVDPRRAPAPGRRPASRPQLRVVDRRAARRRRGPVIAGLVVTVVFVALLASAVFHALLAQGQQRLDRLDQQVTNAQQRYDDLRLKVDQLSAPDRIVSEAGKLGMVAPSNVQPVTPSPGAASEIPDAAGSPGPSGAGADADSTTGYSTVKPYLGTGR